MTQQTMVVSYGARDEDDDYDSEAEGQRGLFGMLQQNKRSSQGQVGGGTGGGGLGSMIEKLGASMTFTRDGNDSDEDSVVVKTFKKMGKKMKKIGQKRTTTTSSSNDVSSSSEEESSSGEEDGSSDSDEEETSDEDSEMDDDKSISKRMGKAAQKLTGKLTKGFLGRSKDDELSSDEEEDPLFNMDNNNNNNKKNATLLPAFGFGKKKQGDDSAGAATARRSEQRRRASNIEHRSTPSYRRSNTDDAAGPTTNHRGPARSKSTDHTYYENMKKTNLSRSKTQDEIQSPRRTPRDRAYAKSETGMNRAAARAKAHEEFMEPAEAVWSMNVTEKMLEEAAKNGEFVVPAKRGGRKTRA